MWKTLKNPQESDVECAVKIERKARYGIVGLYTVSLYTCIQSTTPGQDSQEKMGNKS